MVDTFHCGDIEVGFGSLECCDSCHEDWEEFDLEMIETEVTINGETKLAIICCAAWWKMKEKLDSGDNKVKEVNSDG